MVAFGKFEVAVVPDTGDFEEYPTIREVSPCAWYKATVDPFPVHAPPPESAEAPEAGQCNTIVNFIEVEHDAYYQFDLIVHEDFKFEGCNSVIFDVYVDGQKLEGIIADKKTHSQECAFGNGKWAILF